MGRERFSLSVEATGAATPSSGGGILAKLFGGGGGSKELPPKATTGEFIEAVEIKEPEKLARKK